MNSIARIAVLSWLWLASCTTPLETVHIPGVTAGWKLGYSHDHGKGVGTISEFVPTDERISNWSQLISIQFLESMRGQEPEAAVAELQRNQRDKYANLEQAILHRDEWSVVYEWVLRDSPPHADQHEVARMIEGNHGLHRIAYTRKGPRLEEVERDEWVAILRDAQVVYDGEPIRPQADDPEAP